MWLFVRARVQASARVLGIAFGECFGQVRTFVPCGSGGDWGQSYPHIITLQVWTLERAIMSWPSDIVDAEGSSPPTVLRIVLTFAPVRDTGGMAALEGDRLVTRYLFHANQVDEVLEWLWVY